MDTQLALHPYTCPAPWLAWLKSPPVWPGEDRNHARISHPVSFAMSSLLLLFILSDDVLTAVTGTLELTVVKNIIHGPLDMTSNYSRGHTRYDPELFRV